MTAPATAPSPVEALLAAQWRPPEADAARVLGPDLVAVAPILAEPGASEDCVRLADHHAEAAQRGAARLSLLLSLGVQIIAAAVLLTVLTGVVSRWNTTMITSAGMTEDASGSGE